MRIWHALLVWIILFLFWTGKDYYFDPKTNNSQWEKPTGPPLRSVSAKHLLVKHNKSRRPSSWRQENITRSKDEALDILKGQWTEVWLFQYYEKSAWIDGPEGSDLMLQIIYDFLKNKKYITVLSRALVK